MGTLFDRVSGLPDSGSRDAVQYRRWRGSAVEFRSRRSRSIVCRMHLSPWWITESLLFEAVHCSTKDRKVRQGLAGRPLLLVVSSRKFHSLSEELRTVSSRARSWLIQDRNLRTLVLRVQEQVTLMGCVHWHCEIEHTRHASRALIKLCS